MGGSFKKKIETMPDVDAAVPAPRPQVLASVLEELLKSGRALSPTSALASCVLMTHFTPTPSTPVNGAASQFRLLTTGVRFKARTL